jgi:nitrogen fixation protein FixH
VFPGLIAFNLYSKEMAERGANDPAIKIANAKVIERYQAVKNDASVFEVVEFDKGWAQNNAALAAELTAYNAAEQAAAAAAGKKAVTSSLTGYKYDSALGLLIVKLIKPGNGVLGFVLAALLGAIVSSLAAVLNAASTIFSIDIYHSYINKKASPKQLVAVGRICVGVFVVIGCVLAPMLANPNLGGIFTYIQMFQGFISPGVLAVFVFGLLTVVAVNGVLVWYAVSTFAGVTVNRAYEQGRDYDVILAEAARQEALGWSPKVLLDGRALRVAVVDRGGLPGPGRMEGVMRRPLEGTIIPLSFSATAAGHWTAAIELPKPGQWEARLTLFGPGSAAFDIRHRVIAP